MSKEIKMIPEENTPLASSELPIDDVTTADNPNIVGGGGAHEFHPDPFDWLVDNVRAQAQQVREDASNPSNAAFTDSEIQVEIFSAVANRCQLTYQSSRDLYPLEVAIKCLRQALLLAAEGPATNPKLFCDLGEALYNRFERCDELTNVNEAIECYTRAAQLTPEGDSSRLDCFNNLGLSHWRRFETLGELADLDMAIEYQELAIQLTPEDNPNKPAYLTNLANSKATRFGRFGDLQDMDTAIEYQVRALHFTPEGHARRPIFLFNLGLTWLRRFEQLNDPQDMDRAIECLAQAVQLVPDDHPSKPDRLKDFGVMMLSRFEWFGDLADADKAIECHVKAIQLTPQQGHPSKPDYLVHLGNSKLRRFDRSGDLADVNEAIECMAQAIQLTPEGHPDRSQNLNGLGVAMLRRFERLGDLAELDKAIEFQTQAIQLRSDGPELLSNLGLSWRRRYERLGELIDVDKAIEYQTQAVQLIPDHHPNKPGILNGLGCSWSSRFEQLGELADVNQAIEYQTRAVQLTPDNHTSKQLHLNSLGHSWARRFRATRQLADLDMALECQAKAVELTPEGHPDRSRNLNNLGNSLEWQYILSGDLAALDNSIGCHAQAVELTPEGHTKKPSHYNNLGTSLISRFERLGKSTDLESARFVFQNGAETIITDPDIQIQCARKWANCSVALGFSPLEGYKRSFALLPHLVWLGMTIQGRYSILTKISDLAAEAAAWAVSVQLYDLAIEWLEEGRSVVWNQILQLRTPFDDLANVDSRLASRLKEIASQLEGASSRATTKLSNTESQPILEAQAHHHRNLAAEWARLLAGARQLPGLHDFMLPKKAQELKQAATDGPVIIINAHFSRCDALVIFPQHNDVVHVPLDKFSKAKAIESRTQIASNIGHRGSGDESRGVKRHSNRDQSRDPLRPLVELWSDVVGPVLHALGYTIKLEYRELPHITWCATGALSFLPFHAAGLYDGSSPNAFDLVVSSYTPTLSALLSQSAQTNTPHTGLLAVGQASSRGLSPLPKTIEELAVIKKYAKTTSFNQLDGSNATVEATLNAMEDYSWVHLACHAIQHPANPSYSAFHLYDGNLTLETITKRAFKNKGLAFLSACQTATGDDDLPDEATHLAAGMLMAGYPSVIATMWSIMDDDAPEIAGEVYAYLLHGEKMDHKDAARALHKAVGKLRETVGLESIGRWAPFVHIGV